jgi:hypothetical protein
MATSRLAYPIHVELFTQHGNLQANQARIVGCFIPCICLADVYPFLTPLAFYILKYF